MFEQRVCGPRPVNPDRDLVTFAKWLIQRAPICSQIRAQLHNEYCLAQSPVAHGHSLIGNGSSTCCCVWKGVWRRSFCAVNSAYGHLPRICDYEKTVHRVIRARWRILLKDFGLRSKECIAADFTLKVRFV